MPPAVHHRHHHHYQRAQTVTHVEHRGAHDVTSIYEIVPPSATVPSPAMYLDTELSLSPQPPSWDKATPSILSTGLATRNPTSTSPTTSAYPNPSPPTFLYPEPIVPPQVYHHSVQRAQHPEHTMQHSTLAHGPRPLHHSLAHKEHHSTPTPTVQMCLATLVFIIVTIAGVWCITVSMIHWRGTTTGMDAQNQIKGRGEEDTGGRRGRGWWTWLQVLSPWARKFRYETLRSDEEDETELRTALRASAHDLPGAMDDRAGSRSPLNPYLVPPNQSLQPSMRRIRPRGSSEWAEEHRAFFEGRTPVSAETAAHVSGSSSRHSLSDAELEDVESEAREAQGRRASLALATERGELDGRAYRSWVDLGLAAVDGAVDRVTGKIVRWTDDGGDDEALLLPLAKGKQD